MTHEYAGLPIDPDFDIRKCPGFQNIFPDMPSLQYAFVMLNGVPPCQKDFHNVESSKLLDWLMKSHVNKGNIFIRRSFYPDRRENKVFKYFIFLSKKVFLWNELGNVLLIYHPEVSFNEIDLLGGLIEGKFVRNELKNCIYYIDDVLFFANHKILYLNDSPIDPGIHYNDDLKPVNDKITDFLQKENSEGFIVLTGYPGNGKSTYLKYLTRVCNNRFLYLSKWTSKWLDIASFEWLKDSYNNAVLILEDVDELLGGNTEDSSSLVSFIKNALRGKFRDGFHFPVIITINLPLSDFPAIASSKSPKLVACYDFKPLVQEKAVILAGSLGKKTDIRSPVSIGEIFHS